MAFEEYRMEYMTWPEFDAKKDRVLILPIGATEQHGPHLPLSVDSILAEEFACRLAAQISGVVAPTLSYGYKSKPQSGGGPLFPGTIDLNGETLQKLVGDLIDEFVRDGFCKIFLLSAHFENEAFLIEAMDLAFGRHKDKVTLVLANWWDPMPENVIDQVFCDVAFPGWAFEHAAVTETSLMLYFSPDLVHEDRIVDTAGATPCPYFKYPIDKNAIPKEGVLATARSSSAEKGKIIVDAVIPSLVKIVSEAFGD